MSSDFSSGLETIFMNMDRHYQGLEGDIGDAVQGAGIDCEAETKRRCPVGTPESTGIKVYKGGRLRSSYKYKKLGKMECGVGTNVKYAPPVELGHRTRSGSFVAARPHLFPGFLHGRKNLLEELKSIGVGR